MKIKIRLGRWDAQSDLILHFTHTWVCHDMAQICALSRCRNIILTEYFAPLLTILKMTTCHFLNHYNHYYYNVIIFLFFILKNKPSF